MPGQPRSADTYPFEHTRPLEAYRLHYAMDLPALTELLGLNEEVYHEIVAGTCELSLSMKREVARRVQAPAALVSECAPPLSEAEWARVLEALDEEGPYYSYDAETGELTEVVYCETVPSERIVPVVHQRLAEALTRLNRIHQGRGDADYHALSAHIVERIRAELALPAEEGFDTDAWAEKTLFAAIPRVRVKNQAGEYLYEDGDGARE